MEILRGISVSPGIIISEAVVLDAEDYRIPARTVPADQIEHDLNLLETAFARSIDELTAQKEQFNASLGRDAAEIFAWHLGVLRSSQLEEQIAERVRTRHYSAAYATSIVMRSYLAKFRKVDDPVLAERVRDVQDIERRLLRHILGAAREDLRHLTQPVALVAHDLSPSRAAELAATKVMGVALDVGGPASHTSIVLHSLGRPAVVGVKDVSTRVSGGDTIIIDGVNDIVIISPDEKTLEEYQDRQSKYIRVRDELASLREVEAVSQDNIRFELLANIEFPEETEACTANGADGIGLYRTEFLFLNGGSEPSEQRQYEAYRQAISGCEGKPVTIRTFDLGADKYSADPTADVEPNPMLGLRSIRYSLQSLDMFKVQLRAILRASVEGRVQLMFPLVNSLMEFRQAKLVLQDAMEDLEDEGIPFDRNIKVGIMVETPAAAIQCREFAQEVGFLSIGTNDLVQYVLAVDRGNERVSRFYTTGHPAVLRLIQDVIKACTKADIPCSLCGEMAGQPLYAMLLAGLGLRCFSMAPHNIPEIKKVLRSCSIKQMQRIARRALTFETERQVVNYLRMQLKKFLPDDPAV